MEVHTANSCQLVAGPKDVLETERTRSGGGSQLSSTTYQDNMQGHSDDLRSQAASHPPEITIQQLMLDTEEQRYTVSRSSKIETERRKAAHRPALTKSNTSFLVDGSLRVYIATGTSSIPNIFCDDMFIILPGRSKFTLRRCQYDTASDVNIISYSAWRSLNIPAVATFCQVEGLGGEVNLHGSVNFSWRLRSDLTRKLEKTYPDTFYILPPDQKVTFDCIIGRVWIQNNKKVFQRLLE